MLRSVSKVYAGILENRNGSNHSQQVLVGSRQWFEWLDEQRSFAFVNEIGSFTSRKERRPGGWYWYAYRRRGGKLKTAYLGKTEELYLERLNKIARILAHAGEAPTTEPTPTNDHSQPPPAELPKRASLAHLFKLKDNLCQAIQIAFNNGEMDRAAHLIEQNAPLMFQLGDMVCLKEWLARLPLEYFEERPQLALIHGWTLIASSQAEQADHYLRAVDLSPERLEKTPDGADLTGEALVNWVSIAALQENAALTEDMALRAIKLISPDNHFLRSTVTVGLGYAYLLQGHLEAARRAYRQGRIIAEENTNLLASFIAAVRLGSLERVSGNLTEADRVYRRALEFSKQLLPQTQLPLQSWLLVSLGAVLYEWNELDQAEKLTQEGLVLNRVLGNPLVQILSCLNLSKICQARGRSDEAGVYLKQAEAFVETYHQGPYIRLVFEAWQVKRGLKIGQTALVRPSRLDEQNNSGLLFELAQVNRARLLLAEGQAGPALEMLGNIKSPAEKGGRLAVWLEIELLQALAYRQQGETRKAFGSLKRILEHARSQNYYRLFLDEGPAMAALLDVFRQTESGANRIFLDRLIQAFAQETISADGISPGIDPLPQPKLSRRELQILRLLDEEYSNQQIVSALQIAPGTVKKHLENIYTKLAVHSRNQAIKSARQLKLL